MGGKTVNADHGGETAGLTGLLRCRDQASGHLQREVEMRQGKAVGLRRFYDSEGRLAREFSANERGNSQGRDRSFWPSGQLKTEDSRDNGQIVGLARRYFQNGQLEDLQFFQAGREMFAMAYYPEGYLYELRCPAHSLTPEDRRPCGFEGPQETPLLRSNGQRGALQTWDQGQLVAATSFQDNGSLLARYTRENGRRVQRSYSTTVAGRSLLREERIYEPDQAFLTSPRGPLAARRQWVLVDGSTQLVESVEYQEGRELRAQRWYHNGGIKERSWLEGHGDTARHLRELYSDDARLRSRETLSLGGSRTGPQQSFHPNGQLAQEDTYSQPDTRGATRLIARRSWDLSGLLTVDEEVLEDGSGKRR